MMSSGSQKRTRSERVAALELPPGQLERMWDSIRTRMFLARIGLNVLAAIVLGVVLAAWNPPFIYRSGYTPLEDIVATVSFVKPDPAATEAAQDLAQARVRSVYVLNSEPLVRLRALLRTKVEELTSEANPPGPESEEWRAFFPTANSDGLRPGRQELEEAWERFREPLRGADKLADFERRLAAALAPFEERGLLDKLAREHGKGNYEEIFVSPAGKPETRTPVKLTDVLIGDGHAIQESLRRHMPSIELADRLFGWLRPRLPRTLTLDEAQTKHDLEEARAGVPVVLTQCEAGEVLAMHGQPIDRRQLQVLRLEYDSLVAQRTAPQKTARYAASVTAIFALFLLCGMYIRYRQYGIINHVRQFAVLLGASVITVAIAHWISIDTWRAEVIPLLVFGMAAAIAYCQELAVVVTGALAAIVAMGTGLELPQLLVLIGVLITAILQVGQIRSRAKLIYVGILAGLVAFVLSVVMSILDDQPIGRPAYIFKEAFRLGAWTLATGFLMTGLLPFIERVFGVLTDLSLLELGDVAHPLLQELVRRAPATYNHSITVGSIAEAAADSIAARGLLVRVGAYFHDIGKMLKPGYFVENQGKDGNMHEGLLPAMSTLVIIAHVKDGSDLGRQRHLPRPLIELIQQHHGTTLVEFFYGRAQEQVGADPNKGEVQEAAYRYPGPKPQTKEAGVLMLADVAESACRALVDPTPARIEGLVREMAERRLHDGQFDESGLTLRELRTIERSLVMSLTALYHGRIKYPEQKTA